MSGAHPLYNFVIHRRPLYTRRVTCPFTDVVQPNRYTQEFKLTKVDRILNVILFGRCLLVGLSGPPDDVTEHARCEAITLVEAMHDINTSTEHV